MDAPGRWHWTPTGPELVGPDATRYDDLGDLSRAEVEALLRLPEMQAVRVECGLGVAAWTNGPDAQRLWRAVEHRLAGEVVADDREPPYRASLWRACDGRHAIVFCNE